MDLPNTSGRHGDAHGDSAGTPWAGRTLTNNPFAGDDGGLAPALAAVLDAARASGEPVDVEALLAALPGARLFVPVTAVSAGTDEATGGDLGADMAIPTLRSPDGRDALPVFTSVAALTAWSAKARPVPVEARRAAVSAVQEGQQLLVLDPGVRGPTGSVVVPRPALWALAQGEPWTPSWRDPSVAAGVRAAAETVTGVVRSSCEPGRGGAELRVVLDVVAGLDAAGLADVTTGVARLLGEDAVVSRRVDSLELFAQQLPGAVVTVGRASGGVMHRWEVVLHHAQDGGAVRTPTSAATRSGALRVAARLRRSTGAQVLDGTRALEAVPDRRS
ncbi:SseB family protein [Quadrisphaera sp. INWT6]|uniref:SseB family protein n=1 Tax=Quadrisphaera sp. INWT6 TaxID=2596917 RepID=UPI00189271B8|nr:SseB family protein [Quadrisphaera sp. INWT6]MBF5080989.1 SseB family protein [Quadrisphaera sp. INWT6]